MGEGPVRCETISHQKQSGRRESNPRRLALSGKALSPLSYAPEKVMSLCEVIHRPIVKTNQFVISFLLCLKKQFLLLYTCEQFEQSLLQLAPFRRKKKEGL